MRYLAPDPPEPFSRLTEAIVERWPDYPPYEGIHETVIPHLTVAYGDDALLTEIEADVTPTAADRGARDRGRAARGDRARRALARARPLPARRLGGRHRERGQQLAEIRTGVRLLDLRHLLGRSGGDHLAAGVAALGA